MRQIQIPSLGLPKRDPYKRIPFRKAKTGEFEFASFSKIVFNFAEVHLGVVSTDFTLVFFKPLLLDQNCSEKLRNPTGDAFFDV